MAKVKSDNKQQVEQKTGETVVEAQTAIVNDVQFDAAAFPESSVDSAFAALEAEAPASIQVSAPEHVPVDITVDVVVGGQKLANVEPAREDSDVLNVTPASVEKVIGSEVHGTFDGLLKQVSSPPDEASQVATGDAILSAMDRINPSEEEEEIIAPSEPTPTKAEWKETHRVVTPDSVYLVMVVDDATDPDIAISLAWTHQEYRDDAVVTPALVSVDGTWFLNSAPFAGNVHSLAPAAEDRHTHRRA